MIFCPEEIPKLNVEYSFLVVRDNDDITVVSFNYRTNIFGSPNAPQLNGTGQAQNFGFLDVDAAIQWVYQNIESFGGDPERSECSSMV